MLQMLRWTFAFQTAAFLRADADFYEEVAAGRLEDSGTTALSIAFFDKKMVVSNLGDCRAILSRNGLAVEVSIEHRPDSPTERQRIEAAGGFVDCDGYLNGDLGVSRAIGDFHLSELKHVEGRGPLIAEPEVAEMELGENDEFVVMASDGMWMRSQTVVDIVRDSLKQFNCPRTASEAVVRYILHLCYWEFSD